MTLKVSNITSLLASLALLAAFSGCTLFEDESVEDGTISIEGTVEVVSITHPQGAEPGSIITRDVDYWCEDGELEEEEYTDSSLYVISGGKLYVWTDGNCVTDITMSGTSSTIVGTWTTTSITSSDSVPAAYRPATCEDDDEDFEGVDEVLTSVNASYTISNTSIQTRLSATLCFAPVLAAEFTGQDDIEVLSTSCASVQIRNTDAGQSATISTTLKNGVVTSKFVSGDSTCTLTLPFDVSDEMPVCTEEDDEGEMYEAYGLCIYGSGFYGDLSLGKKAAVPSEQKLKAALKKLPFTR